MSSGKGISWRPSPSLEELKEKIKSLILFLEPLLPLANCHLVQFLTEDQWNNLLPRHLQEDLLHTPFENLKLFSSAEFHDYTEDSELKRNKCSHLQRFLLSIRNFDLDKLDVVTPIPEPSNEKRNLDKVISLSMNKKKAYEIKKISQFIGDICKEKKLTWIADIGSGLGYLSSVLLLEYNYNILALDSSDSNIASSLEQCHKMQTILNRYRKKESQRSNNEVKDVSYTNISSIFDCTISNTSGKTVSMITTCSKKLLLGVTKFIKTDDNLSDIISSQFKSDVDDFNENDIGNVGIVGLHTCGNLSPVSLKLFVTNPCAKFLCNIGCCYHMLDEEFCVDRLYINKQRNVNSDNRYHSEDMNPFHKNTKSNETGFPLSSYLKSLGISLGRNARNLASKPTSALSPDESLKSLFWRALFEVIVKDIHGCWPEGAFVGRRISKKSENFYEYCRRCFNNIGLNSEVSEDKIYSYYEKYKYEEDLFVRFSFLRTCLAPLIENIINMDRLLYLKEQGYGNSHLVRVFDSSLSPRCTAVVSFKE